METFLTFAEASEHADEHANRVCGTMMPDKTFRYFLMAPDAEDRHVHAAAFEVRNGREMSEYEQLLLSTAKHLQKVDAA